VEGNKDLGLEKGDSALMAKWQTNLSSPIGAHNEACGKGGRSMPDGIAHIRKAVREALIKYVPYGDRNPNLSQYEEDIVRLMLDELPGATVDDLCSRAEEFVIAYGCGWRRPLGDEEPWPKAFLELRSFFEKGLCRVFRYFYKHVPGWDRDAIFTGRKPNRGVISGWAGYLANLFCSGGCDCGTSVCLTGHRLSAWNPRKSSLETLENFVLQAVKGRARRGGGILASELARAMVSLLPLEDYGLSYKRILYWAHSQCKFAPLIINEYGTQCECGADFDQYEHKLFPRRRWVSPGSYHREYFWHCQDENCGNYYAEEQNHCPLCRLRRGRGAARSEVWVRTPGGATLGGAFAPLDSSFTQETDEALEEPEGQLLVESEITWSHKFENVEWQDVLDRMSPGNKKIIRLYAQGTPAIKIFRKFGREAFKEAVEELKKLYFGMEGEDNE
jgi:hypothetical protein